jgi:hypothetical protein
MRPFGQTLRFMHAADSLLMPQRVGDCLLNSRPASTSPTIIGEMAFPSDRGANLPMM